MLKIDLRGLGLVDLLKLTVKEFIDDEMSTYASALAYQMFFSLFPFLIFLVTLIGFFDLQNFTDWLREQATYFLPAQAMEQVNPAIDRVQHEQGGLFSVGILVAIWSSSSAVRSAMSAMNKAYDVREGRPTWKRVPLSVCYTIGLAALLICAAGLMVIGPEVMNWLAAQVGLEEAMVQLWNILRWPVAIILLMIAVALVYYVMPDVKQRFRFITPGSILAVLVWIITSLGFAFYVQNFGNYNAVYGSIGAIIVTLLYFYISAAVLLLGAEMNSVIEHHDPAGKDPGEKVPPPEPSESA